jgi:hypothetical protein
MLAESIRIALGILFTLFIPGLLTDIALFRRKTLVERLLYAVFFSIVLDVLIVVLFGATSIQASLTGGIDGTNAWIALIGISAVCLTLIGYRIIWRKEKISEMISYDETNPMLKRIIALQVGLAFLLVAFFYQKAAGNWPYWLLWPIILAQVAISGYAVLRFKSESRVFSLLILEAAVTSIFVFGMIEPYQMNTDSYFEAQYASTIAGNSFWDPTTGNGIAANYYGYNPIIHIIISLLSVTTGISAFIITKYVAIYFIRLALALAGFSFISLIAGKRLASVATLLFILSHGFVLIFVSRRYIAALFIIYYLFFMVTWSRNGTPVYYILAAISAAMALLSDHANSYLLLVFMVGGFFAVKLLPLLIPGHFQKQARSIFDGRMILIYAACMFLWIMLVAQVFIAKDFSYMTEVSSYILTQSSESGMTTFKLAWDGVVKTTRGLYTAAAKRVTALFNDKPPPLPPATVAEYKERLSELSRSTDPKDRELADELRKTLGYEQSILETSGSGLKLTYTYELFLIVISQGMFLAAAIYAAVIMFMRLRSRETLPIDLPASETVYLIAFGIAGFSILGFFINSDQVVFTYTYYWLFSFLVAIGAAFGIRFLRSNVPKYFLVFFIGFCCLLAIGTILLDYAPTLVNRPAGTGIYVEHQYAFGEDTIQSIRWLQVNMPAMYNVFIDKTTWRIASSYYNYSDTARAWYSKRFYIDPEGTKTGIMNKFEGTRNFILFNKKYFEYPSIAYGRRLPFSGKYQSSGTNTIYDNGDYEVLEIG